MKKIFTIAVCIVSATCFQNVKAQAQLDNNPYGYKKITAVANVEYEKASSVKRIFLGDHYRKEWATRVEVPVLFLDSLHGGLIPVKMGGGKQTQSLRLMSKDGKEYVLRSVNKDPSKAIPRELVGTFVDDIVWDQISSSNPYAPMVVSSLADAAGIYNIKPSLYFVPYQPALGDHNKIFGSSLSILEERPVGNQKNNPQFDYADKVVNSEKLLEKILSDPDHRMDEKAFLKARLFDMWIGDWDRHEDQWLWASFKIGGHTIYKPIPRDRDQAFPKLDGLMPQMASRKWALRKIQDFEDHIRDVNGLNTNGAFIDRSFTTSLTWKEWQEVVTQLQTNLTDEKIEQAFNQWPEIIYELSAKQIISKLKKRRDEMAGYANTYYKFLSKEVTIAASDKKESFEVIRLNDDSTSIVVRKGNKEGTVIYQRTFLHSETKEVRLYGLGGNDLFTVSGHVKKGLMIRVIAGDGDDNVYDVSAVKGGSHKTKVYDGDGIYVKAGRETRSYLSNDSLKNNYNRKSFRYDWLAPQMAPGYNPDDGLYVGGGLVFKKQKFGKSPYGYMQSVKANYAFARGAYNFWYEGIFKETFGKWDLHLNATVNAPNYVFNYFGLGNETGQQNDDKNYNRVRSNQVILSPTISRQFGKYHSLDGGFEYQSVKIRTTDNRFITTAQSKLDSSDLGKKYFGGAKLNYQFNTTDNTLYPRKGIKFKTGAEYIQNLEESKSNFLRLSSEASFYTSANSLTAAFRVGGATNIGDGYEFYQANTLGGSNNLRGYRRTRFAGETSLYQNTELRLKLKTAQGYFFRGNFGILGFFDNGRVWIDEENSNKWHHGYGGGVWFLPYNKIAFTASYGISKEAKVINIKAGFTF